MCQPDKHGSFNVLALRNADCTGLAIALFLFSIRTSKPKARNSFSRAVGLVKGQETICFDDVRKQPYSREILANLIYGPSYISLEYALHHGRCGSGNFDAVG
ncbi:MAG: hypothetical protein SRB2_04242 [Desulfobacteraceae bacterium Eth-SRB2]|nr:MAG: hypothetical protein SRB2_04242 [Desulfobacteraceae bacterium Eth-SRB2]